MILNPRPPSDHANKQVSMLHVRDWRVDANTHWIKGREARHC